MLVGEKKCHCCGHNQKIYRYFLDDLDVSTLLKIWQAVVESGVNEVKVQSLDMTHAMKCRTTQLRYFGLLQKVRNEKGKHRSGMWLITRNGGDFIHGRKVVYYYVWTMNNRVIDREKIIQETEGLNQPAPADIVKYASRCDYKVLKKFEPAYDIIGNKPIKIDVRLKQVSMAL